MIKEQKREKLGKLVEEAIEKPLETTDVREQGASMTKDYIPELFKTVEEGKKVYGTNFFITVLTKRERLLKNVLRNFFFHRSTCPTPDYDQAVWYYVKDKDEVEFIWIIPSREFCFVLIENALTLDPEYKEILNFVLDFKDGTLMNKAKEFNREDVLIGKAVLKVINGNE